MTGSWTCDRFDCKRCPTNLRSRCQRLLTDRRLFCDLSDRLKSVVAVWSPNNALPTYDTKLGLLGGRCMQVTQLLKIFNVENTHVLKILRISWFSYSIYLSRSSCPFCLKFIQVFSYIFLSILYTLNKNNTTEEIKLYLQLIVSKVMWNEWRRVFLFSTLLHAHKLVTCILTWVTCTHK